MISKDQIVVLSLVNYKGRNAIVKTFGQEFGFKSFYLSRSANSKGSKKKNSFQPFSLLEIIYKAGKSGLPLISEFQVLDPLIEIKTDVKKSAIAFLLAEVMTKVLAEGEENKSLYNFLEGQISSLNTTKKLGNFHLKFLVKLCDYIGIQPSKKQGVRFFDIKEGEFRSSMPNHPHFMGERNTSIYLNLMSDQSGELSLSGEEKSAFLQELFRFYEYHVAGFTPPKSLDVLRDIFSL